MNRAERLIHLYSNTSPSKRIQEFYRSYDDVAVVVPFTIFFTPEGCKNIALAFSRRIESVIRHSLRVITYDNQVHSDLSDLQHWIGSRSPRSLGIINPYNSAGEMNNFVENLQSMGLGYLDTSIDAQNANLLDPDFIRRSAASVSRAYDLFSDSDSRDAFEMILKVRMTGDRNLVEKSPYPEYLHPLVSLQDYQEFIDCGASDGSICKLFYELSGGHLDIHAFEPDAENFSKLSDCLSSISREKLNLCNRGVWRKSQELFIQGEGISARIDHVNGSKIAVVSLDDQFCAAADRRRIIKMDIEGAEFDALLGAAELIKETHPTLVVCLYHLPDDLWRIPLLISAINPNYKFYLGHHGTALYESVLYAL